MAVPNNATYMKEQLRIWYRFLEHLDTALIRIISDDEVDKEVHNALQYIERALDQNYTTLYRLLIYDPRRIIVQEEYLIVKDIFDKLEVYEPKLNERLEKHRQRINFLQRKLKLLPNVKEKSHTENRIPN